jgi:hypothetical protein
MVIPWMVARGYLCLAQGLHLLLVAELAQGQPDTLRCEEIREVGVRYDTLQRDHHRSKITWLFDQRGECCIIERAQVITAIVVVVFNELFALCYNTFASFRLSCVASA